MLSKFIIDELDTVIQAYDFDTATRLVFDLQLPLLEIRECSILVYKRVAPSA